MVVNDENAFIENQAKVAVGENQYMTNEVTNHTYDEVTEKDVVKTEDPTISIDGAAVEKGDELEYSIDYTNTTGNKITVVIVDTIPAHTTYVEGSASHGGVYADGKITWTLEVAPQETVTVTFKVVVDGEPGDAIKNQATVQEGENEYVTNEVENQIPDQEMVTIRVQKILENLSDEVMGLDGFEFILTMGDASKTIVSNEEGIAGFNITFFENHVGETFVLTLVEKQGDVEGMEYDATVYEITIQIVMGEDGKMMAIINGVETSEMTFEFTNTYDPEEPEDSSEPESSDPESSEPESSEPESSEPESSEPESSEPESSEPESSDPESSEPESSDPESSEPESSDPESSEPESSEPESSDPESSEPESSEPESSDPESSDKEENKQPQTGDDSNLQKWVAMMMISAAGLMLMLVGKKLKRAE